MCQRGTSYMPDKIDISVVICTRNRCNELNLTLGSLARMNRVMFPDGNVAVGEIIIVDNNSSDETRFFAETYSHEWCKTVFLRQERTGKSFCLNLAILRARGEAIAFIDDDVRVPQDWLERLTGPILENQTDAVIGGASLAKELKQQWMTKKHLERLACIDSPAEGKALYMTGVNMAISRRVLEKVPCFDTDLGPGRSGFCEDTLFTLAVRSAGYRVLSRLDVQVEHHPSIARFSRSAWKDRMIKEGESHALMYMRYGRYNPRLSFLRFLVAKIKALWLMPRERLFGLGPATEPELDLWFVIALNRAVVISQIRSFHERLFRIFKTIVPRGKRQSSQDAFL